MRRFVICLVLVTFGCTSPQKERPVEGTVPPSSTVAEGTTANEETVWADGTEPPDAPSTATTPSTTAPPTSTTTSATTPQTTTQPPAPTQREITIESVQIANPVVITGRARTFENNVVVRVRDARGKLLTETFTTANGDMGNHNPYRASVWLTRHPGNAITVEALEYSAKDGSERSLVARKEPFNLAPIAVELALPSSPQSDCTKTRLVKRELPRTVSMARVLVEALIAEPSPFPKGSRVQSVNLRDGVVTVDFNERLRNVGGSCAAQAIRASVTGTLRRLPNVREVVITAAGNRDQALQP
ncbi:MAG TPA: Gmad2 immunoglobulin-like domain-containing protein [Thermoanaerobaculia bacterium]